MKSLSKHAYKSSLNVVKDIFIKLIFQNGLDPLKEIKQMNQV